MKAFRYHGEKNFSLDDVPMPKAEPGDVIAKVLTASVCGTDLRTYRNGNPKLSTPVIIGHEACVEVVEAPVGSGYVAGRRYTVVPAIGCGECRSCRKGRTNMCDNLLTIGFQTDGTFAEYVRIPALGVRQGHLLPVPDGVSHREASVVEPVACAINAQTYLNIGEGDNVLIYGSGYLGCVHAELAFMQGARRVIIAEISQKRRDQAAAHVPRAHVLNSIDPDFADQVRAIATEGVDVVITAAPAGVTHKQGLELLYKNGRISLFGGLPGDGHGFLDSNLIHYKELGVFGAHASTVAHNEQALEAVASGKLNVDKYITSFALADATSAFEALISEDATKAVLVP